MRSRPALLLMALLPVFPASAGEWRPCPACPPMVTVPAGAGVMGDDGSKFANEKPAVPVRFDRPFALSATEITFDDWRECVKAKACKGGQDDHGWGRGKRPVINITWDEAQAFAAWVGRQAGLACRLPTEAEWEYACRAGSRSLYPHGDDPQGLVTTGNTFDQAAAPLWPHWRQHALAGNDGHAFTAPVGSYAPNAFGLHDMLGNAWEWVSDWHGDTYYAQSPRTDPAGPADGSVRVRRGGSWHTWALYARCGYRNWNSPQTRYTLVGMRLVREIDAPP